MIHLDLLYVRFGGADLSFVFLFVLWLDALRSSFVSYDSTPARYAKSLTTVFMALRPLASPFGD